MAVFRASNIIANSNFPLIAALCESSMLRFLVILLLVGCEGSSYVRSEASIELGDTFKDNNYRYIDFATLQGDRWSKVCFLGPYNSQSSEALGFSWDVNQHTDVLASDGHNVIIFATDSEVITYIVHSRAYGDFWQLTGECYPREHSKLYKNRESGAWSVGR